MCCWYSTEVCARDRPKNEALVSDRDHPTPHDRSRPSRLGSRLAFPYLSSNLTQEPRHLVPVGRGGNGERSIGAADRLVARIPGQKVVLPGRIEQNDLGLVRDELRRGE